MRYYAEITMKVAYDTNETDTEIISDEIYEDISGALNNTPFPDFEYIDVLEIIPSRKEE